MSRVYLKWLRIVDKNDVGDEMKAGKKKGLDNCSTVLCQIRKWLINKVYRNFKNCGPLLLKYNKYRWYYDDDGATAN